MEYGTLTKGRGIREPSFEACAELTLRRVGMHSLAARRPLSLGSLVIEWLFP